MNRAGLVVLFAAAAISFSAGRDAFTDARFEWKCGPVLQSPAQRPDDPCVSVKDPSVVRVDGRWHVFTTIRSAKRTHQIEYSSFADWSGAEKAERHILPINPAYFCAPQVFYFTPHRKWYLVHQVADPAGGGLLPAVSTSDRVDNWSGWSAPETLYAHRPAAVKSWIDFWVICDESRVHLFFTSNDGTMSRAETALADFPRGWSEPRVVLRGDIFEASHTYRLRGHRYLTIIEALGKPGRYYKAYVADRLDGEWRPLAAVREQPFASKANIHFTGDAWTESVSHGELIRTGVDEHMEIDPRHLQFLFQGVMNGDMTGKPYGEIPWRLGLLESVD